MNAKPAGKNCIFVTQTLLLQESFAIGENETAGEVHDKMKELGARVLLDTVKGLAEGTLKERSQDSLLRHKNGVVKHAPKIFTDTCNIDFNKPVEEVHNLIRGLSPFPGAFTILNGKTLKIYRSEKELIPLPSEVIAAGNHLTDGKTFLKFSCLDGYVLVKELQLEGKKKMSVHDFLQGYHFR